ncbi:MAG: HupE/UreJ family protein [Pseudomonadota bacterium]
MMRRLLDSLLLLLALTVWTPATAHVTELAVLRLTEVGEGRYTLTWEMRPTTPTGTGLQPVFPPHCTATPNLLDCGAEGLVGRLGFEGIGAGQSAAMFKIRDLEGSTQIYTVTPANPVVTVSRSFDASSWEGMTEIALAYTAIGFEHILLGIDHLLFVLGLIWIARGRWMLLKTITAFTVAHSVTLAAVTFGWVGVPEVFVNAMIALSIVFIGVEVLYARQGRSTLTLRHPWAVSFVFGLLHGFGFADALVALGLPETAVPLALLSFNIGVELGQIAFVLIVLALAWAYRVMRVRWPDWAHVAPAYAIGSLAALWFYQRVEVLFVG